MIYNYPAKNKSNIKQPLIKNPRDRISNKVKIDKSAHAMTFVNPHRTVKSGAQGLSISRWLATPVTHYMAFYTRVKQTDQMTNISVNIMDVTDN